MQREPHLSNAALMARRSAAVARGVGQAHEIFVSRAAAGHEGGVAEMGFALHGFDLCLNEEAGTLGFSSGADHVQRMR